jgi:hypothetical protein
MEERGRGAILNFLREIPEDNSTRNSVLRREELRSANGGAVSLCNLPNGALIALAGLSGGRS